MKKAFIGVRDVDAEVFRRFRARAIAQKLRLGDAITQAMKKSLENKETEKSSFMKFFGVLKESGQEAEERQKRISSFRKSFSKRLAQ